MKCWSHATTHNHRWCRGSLGAPSLKVVMHHASLGSGTVTVALSLDPLDTVTVRLRLIQASHPGRGTGRRLELEHQQAESLVHVPSIKKACPSHGARFKLQLRHWHVTVSAGD
eukprot:3148401-Rhodomonas_salina.1